MCPVRSITSVVGVPEIGTTEVKSSVMRSSGSLTLGYPMSWLCVNASAFAVLSRTSTPRNDTPSGWYCSATTASVAASDRQGTHQEPQKFSTTTLPRYEEKGSGDPVSVVPENSGASGRCPSGQSTALVLPSRYTGPPPLLPVKAVTSSTTASTPA